MNIFENYKTWKFNIKIVVLNMRTTGIYRTLTAYLSLFMLAVSIAGCGDSRNDNLSIQDETTEIEKPDDIVARTGPIVAVRVGETAFLNGENSFSESSQPLSFFWSFSSRPDTSKAILQNATTPAPSFVADARGDYRVQLVVSAGGISSRRAVQLVVATIAPERVTGPFFHQGLSSSCVNCHNDEFGPIPSKSQSHMASSNVCETCHSPLGFDLTPYVDHQEVFAICSECHNGITAIGKSEFHISTVGECDDCHNTSSFFPLAADGSFDHAGISSRCITCHNGNLAIGKTPAPPHPDTRVECGFCHTTGSFKGAFPDHSGPAVAAEGISCDSCHGVTATGQPDGHPLTNIDCDSCHSIAGFSLGGVFNHSLVDPTVQSCESCHNETNSINAPSKSSAIGGHPVTSSDCGNCHNTDSFIGTFIDHTGIVDNCAACHTGNAGEASGIPTDGSHMPTTEDCSVCHTPGTFASGAFSHAPSYIDPPALCADCHNDVISVGKLIDHLPTIEDCSTCHTTTDFAGATFDHVGIDFNNCASCHNGAIGIGKPFNHVPTTLDCSSCHDINNFASFAGITFNHLGIDSNNCAACHDTGIATPKKVNHIPAQDDCSSCHDSTAVFSSTTFLGSLHPGINRGCEGCHNSRIFATNPALFKAASHLPTLQDCYLCHTVSNPGFKPVITPFTHTGISGNCASCHDGSVNNVSAGARGKTPDHPATTADCSVCHNTSATFADAIFDHSGRVDNCTECHGDNATGAVTKKNIGHVPTNQDCSVCHVTGTFAPAVFNHTGIVSNCASCHNGIDATGKEDKLNPPHIPTTEDCSACHTTTAFAGAKFDHQNILGNCASCHDGNTAIGKANNHVPTNGDCVNCHVTTGFVPATFDHIGIVDNCLSCHDGAFATGKKAGHVDTNQDCGVCHNTQGFIPATFDHTGIVDNCASCHDGVTATGKEAKINPPHVATALDCSSCHTTATFVGGTWTHDAGSTGNCDDCHNSTGGGATFKPSGHFNTTVQCDACHTTNGWAPTSFSHNPLGDYPGNHRLDPGCSGCHGNVVTIPFVYRWAQYAPFCAACHANNFASEGDHNGGRGGTVEQNKDCSGGGRGCHRVSDSGF